MAKITNGQVAQALLKTAGLLSPVAQMLGVTRQAIYYRIKASGKLQRIQREAKESTLDLCEMKLITNIKSGDQKAIEYYLNCIGRERGYGRQQAVEVTGLNGNPIEINNNDLSQLNNEELYELKRLLKKSSKS